MKLEVQKTNVAKLIVDADHAAHRAFHAHEELATKTGVKSGTFYGFFSILLRQLETLAPMTTAICWGDRRDNLTRKNIYPEYKSNRTFSSEDYVHQVENIQYALYDMGFKQYYAPRQEGDDCIATLVHTVRPLIGEDERIVILTGDKDLMQLVCDNVHIVVPASAFQKFDKTYKPADVLEKFKVPPRLIADYLSLIGDTGDNIPGVKGIGPVTAVELLKEHGSIKNWYKDIDTFVSGGNTKATIGTIRKLQAGKKDLLLSKKLISLATTDIEMGNPVTFPEEGVLTTANDVFDMYEMVKIRPGQFDPFVSKAF